MIHHYFRRGMCVDGHEIGLSIHVIYYFVFSIKVSLFIWKISPIVLKIYDSQGESGEENLNLFGVTKQTTKCVIMGLIEARNYLVRVLREL